AGEELGLLSWYRGPGRAVVSHARPVAPRRLGVGYAGVRPRRLYLASDRSGGPAGDRFGAVDVPHTAARAADAFRHCRAALSAGPEPEHTVAERRGPRPRWRDCVGAGRSPSPTAGACPGRRRP